MPLKSGIPCNCGRWEHRATRGLAPIGLTATITFYRVDESHCPKCRSFYVLLWHVTADPFLSPQVRSVGICELPRGEDGLRRSLSMIREEHPGEVGLNEDAIEAIVASARAWAA